MEELSNIQHLIYVIRGQRVMLDKDLASMYGVETKVLNQSVKRNIERFPEDFMFQLNTKEWEIFTKTIQSQFVNGIDLYSESDGYNLRSQIVTSRYPDKWGGSRRPPYAFTEHGVAMLSSVLRSPLAIQVNIGIIRAFVEFRRMAASLPIPDSSANAIQLRKDFEALKEDIQHVREEMNDILADQNDINESTRAQLAAINDALIELQTKRPEPKPCRPIGFIQPKDE